MQVDSLDIPDVRLLLPTRHKDERGLFSEIYNLKALRAHGLTFELQQENYSWSGAAFTVRGLHFQTPPAAQAKLIQVTQGAILDVAVDLRHGSPWYGRHVAVTLSADNWQQMYVPAGFAHGFCTLEADTAVIYKVDSPYAPEHDTGIRWNDPALGIGWPAGTTAAVLSDKDRELPLLADSPRYFTYTP